MNNEQLTEKEKRELCNKIAFQQVYDWRTFILAYMPLVIWIEQLLTQRVALAKQEAEISLARKVLGVSREQQIKGRTQKVRLALITKKMLEIIGDEEVIEVEKQTSGGGKAE